MTEEKKEEIKETSEETLTDKNKEKSGEEEKKNGEKEVEKIEVPQKFKKIVEDIEEMSVLDLSELVKILEKKFNVSAAAPVVAAASGNAASDSGASEAEEKSSYNVELKTVGDKKIEVIKAVRDIVGKGLKEAKDIVDAVEKGPQIIKENVKKEEAEEIKKKFEAAGAGLELK